MKKILKQIKNKFSSLIYNVKKKLLKIFFYKFFNTLIKYVDNCLFFFKNVVTKNTFINNCFLQIGSIKRKLIKNKHVNRKLDYALKPEDITEEELQDELFLFQEGKKKKPYLQKRKHTIDDNRIFTEYMEDKSGFNFFFDPTYNMPLYKTFFTLNRAFTRLYHFWMHYFNNYINPTTFFFEMFKYNRRFYYRFNKFPRKKRKERILNYHIIFFKKYYYFLMLKRFFYTFISCIILNFLLINNIVLSILLTCLIFFNPLFILFYKNLSLLKLKKLIVGIKLNIYKNYNNNNNLYLSKGFINTKLERFYSLNKEKEINSMKKILRLEIYKVFYLLNLKKNIKENIKNFHVENNFRKLNKIIYYKLFINFDKIILKKILFLISFLYKWKTFYSFKLFFSKSTVGRRGEHFKSDFLLSNMKGGFINLYGFLATLRLKNKRSKEKLAEEVYFSGNKKKQKNFEMYSGLKYFQKITKFELDSFSYILKLKNLISEENRSLFDVEFLKSKIIKNKLMKLMILFVSSFHIKLIENSRYELENMFIFFSNLHKNKENFTLKFFDYEFNFFFKNKQNFINDKIFNDHLFLIFNEIYPIKQNFLIPLEKYIILIEKEKEIYLMEEKLSNFDLFTENLLFDYLIKFSQNDKSFLIDNNKEYSKLIIEFKNYLKIAKIKNYNIDDFKYYINENQDPLFIFIELFSQEYLKKNNIYRKKEFFVDEKINNYNIRHFSDFFKKKYIYLIKKKKFLTDKKYKYFMDKVYPKLIEIFYKESSKKDK